MPGNSTSPTSPRTRPPVENGMLNSSIFKHGHGDHHASPGPLCRTLIARAMFDRIAVCRTAGTGHLDFPDPWARTIAGKGGTAAGDPGLLHVHVRFPGTDRDPGSF